MMERASPEAGDLCAFLRQILRTEDADNDDVASSFLEDRPALDYLEELLQSDVDRLQKEDARLEEESKRLHSSKAALVLENYAVLLEASSQVEEISRHLPDMKKQLQSVLSHYASTEEQARTFWSKATEFGSQRIRTQQQIGQLGLIQDILEIPFLIDNLAKHGLFDEIVDLVHLGEKLVTAAPDGKIVQKIAEETRSRTWVVMNLLSHQLRTVPVQLLQALKIVSLERRLGQLMAIDVEDHVRTDFLQARSIFISSLVGVVTQKHTFQYLTKIAEICRLHFFDTMNYYLSVFPDNSELPSNLRVLPYMWLNEELSDLCSIIEKSLHLVEDNRLESLFNQCMQFSDVLSRFGSNLSTDFFRIFLAHLINGLTTDVEAAITDFETTISDTVIIRKARPSTRSAKTDDLSLSPTDALSEYPVLLELHNSVASALARPRSCMISSLIVPITFALNSLLQRTTVAVNDAAASRRVSPEFEHTYKVMLVPLVEKARDSLCPLQEAASILGVTSQQAAVLCSFSKVLADSSALSTLPNGHEI